MQQDHFDKLMAAAAEGAYMSIAINEDGTPVFYGFVPWERTLSGFNMRTPKVTLAVSDLQDEAIMQALRACKLIGCYIFTPLDSYDFIAVFTELQDLFILHGERMESLNFTRNLLGLFMLFLEDVTLPSLQPLIDACNEGQSGPGKCFGFRNCTIEDTSALAEVDFTLSELLVWPVAGDSPERWESARKPGVFKFYGSGEGENLPEILL